MVDFEAEIDNLRGDHSQKSWIRMKEETVNSHRERLDLVDQQYSHVEELFHQCGRCEASLHWTRIQVAELKAESLETSISALAETLRRTIKQAQDVQEEMNRLGY